MAAQLVVPVGFKFYRAMIEEIAVHCGVNPVTIAAICWQESAFQADAFRFEPDFWNRYLKPKAQYRDLNPRRVSSSYGLMQVMYCRVHEDKLTSNDALPPEHLFVPELNVMTGATLYAELVQWASGKTQDADLVRLAALASYNGGRGGNDPSKDTPLRNAKYAREVLEKLAILKKVMG